MRRDARERQGDRSHKRETGDGTSRYAVGPRRNAAQMTGRCHQTGHGQPSIAQVTRSAEAAHRISIALPLYTVRARPRNCASRKLERKEILIVAAHIPQTPPLIALASQDTHPGQPVPIATILLAAAAFVHDLFRSRFPTQPGRLIGTPSPRSVDCIITTSALRPESPTANLSPALQHNSGSTRRSR
jgi:hypothetical protein